MIYTLVAWAINLIYLASLVPQVVKNHRRGSVRGVNPLMVWASWNGYALYMMYAYGQNMPLAYKICTPLWLVCSTALVMQKSFYTRGAWWAKFYAANSVVLAGYWLASLSVPALSLWAGWSAAVLWGVYCLPQIYQNAQKRSTKGLSQLFVILTLLGAVLEAGLAYFARLPLPTLVNALREIAILAVLYAQVQKYSPSKKKNIAQQRGLYYIFSS